MIKKVAFIVQRCGVEVNGGSELLCLKLAQRMAQFWAIEILTTCALDYTTWEDYYTPGLTEISGVTARRFSVSQPRNTEIFNHISEKLYARLKSASIEEQEEWMLAQGPVSNDLVNYVKQYHHQYDAFIFFTYLYATTYLILPLVADKSYLVSCAHDELPIYLNIWDDFFKKPRGFIFNTPEERSFLERRFPSLSLDGPIAGVAIDQPAILNAQQFRQSYNIHEPFILYVGRIDPSKGCEALFNHFIDFKNCQSAPRKLVLIGKPAMSIPTHPDIIALGFVDEQVKWDALAACDLLIMPSPYESLSMVLLEAWSVGKPVLVNGECEVLVGQCRRSQGGLWYTNNDEFKAAIELLDEPARNQLGQQGKRFVESNYVWSKIEQDFLDVIQ